MATTAPSILSASVKETGIIAAASLRVRVSSRPRSGHNQHRHDRADDRNLDEPFGQIGQRLLGEDTL